MVPRTMLKEWAMTTFPSATDYWTFRKMFTLQLALAGFAEYVLHLSRLNPDMMYIHQVAINQLQWLRERKIKLICKFCERNVINISHFYRILVW